MFLVNVFDKNSTFYIHITTLTLLIFLLIFPFPYVCVYLAILLFSTSINHLVLNVSFQRIELSITLWFNMKFSFLLVSKTHSDFWYAWYITQRHCHIILFLELLCLYVIFTICLSHCMHLYFVMLVVFRMIRVFILPFVCIFIMFLIFFNYSLNI